MHHQTADKFLIGKVDLPDNGVVLIILCRKCNRFRRDFLNPGIGDGNPVCISSEIFDGITKAIEGLPDIWTPCFVVEDFSEFTPGIRILKPFTGSRKSQLSSVEALIKQGKKLAAKFSSENASRNEEATAASFEHSVLGESAAGNNAMDMWVEIEFLSPGVQYLDNAGCCAEVLNVSG